MTPGHGRQPGGYTIQSIQDVAGFKSTAVAIRHLEIDNCLDWITQNFKTNVLSLYAWATAYSDFLI